MKESDPLDAVASRHRYHGHLCRVSSARRGVARVNTSWGVAEPLIHVCAREMSIMIGIDETRADHAARIGTRHHDDDNNSSGARAPALRAPRGIGGLDVDCCTLVHVLALK